VLHVRISAGGRSRGRSLPRPIHLQRCESDVYPIEIGHDVEKEKEKEKEKERYQAPSYLRDELRPVLPLSHNRCHVEWKANIKFRQAL